MFRREHLLIVGFVGFIIVEQVVVHTLANVPASWWSVEPWALLALFLTLLSINSRRNRRGARERPADPPAL